MSVSIYVCPTTRTPYYYTWSHFPTNNCGSAGLSDIKISTQQDRYAGVLNTYPLPPAEVLPAIYDVIYTTIQRGDYRNKVLLMVGPVDYQCADGSPTKEKSCIVTHDFVNWLIENKKGMVVACPVFANVNYGKDPASLNQMWMFIPNFLFENTRVILGTEGMYNVPETDTKFYEKVSAEINPATKKFEDMFSTLNNAPITRYAKARDAINAEKDKISIRRRSMRWITKTCDTAAKKCC